MKRFGSALVATATVFLGGGCIEEESVDSLVHSLAVRPVAALDVEADFVSLASELPSFAGYFYDEGGDLVILVTDLEVAEVARAAVGKRRVATLPVERGGGPPFMRVEPADYTFAELDEWRSRIVLTVMELEGVVSMDLDERANRLVIELADAAAHAAAVEDALDLAGVPLEATLIAEGEYPTLTSHRITDMNRPVTGALVWGPSGCTIGLVARDSVGNNGFFSASHCSTTMFGVDLSAMHQPSPTNLIGYETQDPLGWDCDGSGPGTRICRYSDAAFWVRASGVSSSFARIARTEHWLGSKVIDHSNPTFRVSGERASTVGLPVDRIGVGSGWRYSSFGIASTCVHVNITVGGNPYRVYCAIRVNNTTGVGGDSGAASFYWNYPTGDVEALGIHFASDSSYDYFSSMAGIREDFGNIATF